MRVLDRLLVLMTVRPWKPLCWRASRACIAAGMLYTLLVNIGVRHELWGPRSNRWRWVRDESTVDVLAGPFPGVSTIHRDAMLFEVTYFLAVAAILLWAFRANFATTLVAGVSYLLVAFGNFDVRDGSVYNVAAYFIATLLVIGSVKPSHRPLRILVHNAATVWITLQVCVIYLSSGLYKVVGEPWRQGAAMEGILLNPSSSYSPLAIAASATLIGVGATLATVIFEILAPAAVFTRSALLRRTIVLTLIAMHVGIIFIMGLIGFGLIMIGMATMMLRDSDLLWLRSCASRVGHLTSQKFVRPKAESKA